MPAVMHSVRSVTTGSTPQRRSGQGPCLDAAAMRRRTLLSLAAGAPLSGCATGGKAPGERIVDASTGHAVSRVEVLERMSDSAFILMGELHDNALHHERRAALLHDIGKPISVVVEHLPSGAAPALMANARGDTLLQALQGAGFDARGWRWPIHESVFAAIASSGHSLRGGNLPRELARRVALDGPAALPADLRHAIESAPLTAAATAALEQDLIDGHCGRLPVQQMPRMVWAQRGRDAAMAAALREARAGPSQGVAVLLAGNAHVRRDYGVAGILAQAQPTARVLSIAFLETGAALPPGAFDLAWITPGVRRSDPCAALSRL
jgi:uncharacterized iron-regulated protein